MGPVALVVVELGFAQNTQRHFSVADDIALTQLSRTASPQKPGSAVFSPDRQYFFILADRGRLDLDRAESSIRVYRVTDILDCLSHPNNLDEPAPFWSITQHTYKYGPILDDVRWLADSSGLAFLATTSSGNHQLLLADVNNGVTQALTPGTDDVTGFDVRNNQNYVYSVLSPAILQNVHDEQQAAILNGTGRSLYELLFPNQGARNLVLHDLSDLWVVIEGKSHRVLDKTSKTPVSIHRAGQVALALSPDRHFLLTALTVRQVPADWESLFAAHSPAFLHKLRARAMQNTEALSGYLDLSEYVLVNVYNDQITQLTNAPIGSSLGWAGAIQADWSSNGESLLLSDTFWLPKNGAFAHRVNRPCIVVIDFRKDASGCVDGNNAGGEDWKRVASARFVAGNNNEVNVTYSQRHNQVENTIFVRHTDGAWEPPARASSSNDNQVLEVTVREGTSDPPLLLATNNKAKVSRVIWDPNPQLKAIKLGETFVYKWKDAAGRDWLGGLFKPPDYVPGRRYPLVIQAHAFTEHQFMPSGSYPTVFAAQELAAAGFVVLQVENCPLRLTAEEAACQVAGYEAAVEQLAKDGLVDPNQLGIVGFSRSCYYVVEALTTSRLKFGAALIADGVTFGYSQYIENLDLLDSNFAHEADVLVGAPPFGPGLSTWLTRSPVFNMQKITTPVEVIATNLGGSILAVWEPYATLRYLHKPVELILLNSEEHVFTNPENRLLSQQNTVDWFRFWLQQEEDHEPAQDEKHMRWRELRAMQQTNP